MQATQAQDQAPKRAYSVPKIEQFGDLRELTQGGGPDGVDSKANRMRPASI